MTVTTCDICNQKINGFQHFHVLFPSGTHPHSGAKMNETKDICVTCLKKLPLQVDSSFQSVLDKYKFIPSEE
jgi:hypothetical protein